MPAPLIAASASSNVTLAVLVVAVADEDHRAPIFGPRQAFAQLDERIENCRAAGGLDVPDGLDDRPAVARWAGQRPEALGEGGDDDGVLRPQEGREPGRGVLHEVESPRHALAAVDEQRKRGGHALVADEVDSLRHAVFLDDEALELRPLTNRPVRS